MKKPPQRAARVGGLVVALERLSALTQPYGRALSLCLSALLSPPLKRAGAYLRHIRQYQRLHEVLRKPPYAVPLALCRCLDSGREQNLYGSYWRASACAFRFNGGPVAFHPGGCRSFHPHQPRYRSLWSWLAGCKHCVCNFVSPLCASFCSVRSPIRFSHSFSRKVVA